MDQRRRTPVVPDGVALIRANRKDLGLGFWASLTAEGRREYFQGDEPAVALDQAHRRAIALGLRASTN